MVTPVSRGTQQPETTVVEPPPEEEEASVCQPTDQPKEEDPEEELERIAEGLRVIGLL